MTWTRWNGINDFLELVTQTYPEIEWEYTAYAGANRTGYSWARMRAAIESGMDAHIAKPVQVDTLKSTIQEMLDSRLKHEGA